MRVLCALNEKYSVLAFEFMDTRVGDGLESHMGATLVDGTF